MLDKLRELMDNFRGSWLDIAQNIPSAIKAVEEVGKAFALSGADKKALAVAVLDKIIKVSWLWAPIKKLLIEIVIECAVAAFNRFGHDWLGKVV